jgi:hypothetical protein
LKSQTIMRKKLNHAHINSQDHCLKETALSNELALTCMPSDFDSGYYLAMRNFVWLVSEIAKAIHLTRRTTFPTTQTRFLNAARQCCCFGAVRF